MAVPNTNSFNLLDVVNTVIPTTNDLIDCFADAVSEDFDSTYSGSKNSLLNFRNYGVETPVTIAYLPLSESGAFPVTINTIGSQKFINNVNATKITLIYFGYGGASGAQGIVRLYDDATNTLLHTENVVGYGSGGLKPVSIATPINTTQNQVFRLEMVKVSGYWFLNTAKYTYVYPYNSVVNGVTQSHPDIMEIYGVL